ncbi:unnamed protein product [Peniophora sp. CBMAI 1063]|nr:unnamed protein product [Peniophora sp. CBMAI 1063]
MAEIFMRGIPYSSDHIRVKRELAKELHKHPFTMHTSYPINFSVWLFKDKSGRGRPHGGTGTLTLPTTALGEVFLNLFGPGSVRPGIWLDGRQVLFSRSNRPPRGDVVESIAHVPYQDPAVLEARQVREGEFASKRVNLHSVQFGWDCRDDVFSSEWEYQAPTGLPAYLMFSDDPRELRVHLEQDGSTLMIAIRVPSILAISAHTLDRPTREHAVWVQLATAPHYERQTKPVDPDDDPGSMSSMIAAIFTMLDKPEPRQRLSCLPFANHNRVVAFTSHALRLVLRSQDDLQTFWDLAETAELPKLGDYPIPVEERGLFSVGALDLVSAWQRRLSLGIAFQVEGIMRALLLDAREVLAVRPLLQGIIARRGVPYTVAFLKYFRLRLCTWWSDWEFESSNFDIRDFFGQVRNAFEQQTALPVLDPRDTDVVQTMHVVITPTSMALDGPFPELSNRVLRTYPREHHECFLRVTFAEEGRVPYRWDRNVDGRRFVDMRVGTILRQGLAIGGHRFDFLAYSMSALRERSVWFLKPFTYTGQDGQTVRVDAPTIVAGLGTFPYETLRCPARYAARLSQAFTATNQIRVELAESQVLRREDIWTPDGLYCYTDGVGTISLELARRIWAYMNSTRKRARRSQGTPRAYQIRFQGAKGMLSVDYRLQGSLITIPPSMTKFEAPGRFIEIAQAFTTPFPYTFNRPLIMLLEGLGVPYEVFERYQDAAVQDVNDSSLTIAGAGRLFEKFGLGASFRMPSVLNSLAKLDGLTNNGSRPFFEKILHCAKNHILRDLKNYARIPVPGAWTLGVADMHGELGPNEVYACIRKDGQTVYLEGDVMISRSPTSHPGDVQIAHAIGAPQPHSSFYHERLPNMIVFSVCGERPLPSCLGGGDLDGDIYDCVPLQTCPDLRPRRLHEPASYTPVQKKMLNRPSTMNDVADFVVDYINSDVVGLVATQWLMIADQSEEGIFDPDCLTLSQLHSDAVDFPKSGTAVQVDRIPRLKFKEKPDWSAAETINLENSTAYYESQRAIGKLFRRIELADGKSKRENRRQRERVRRTRAQRVEDLTDALAGMTLGGTSDEVAAAIEHRVHEFIDLRAEAPREVREHVARLFESYASELQSICATQVISHRRNSMLSEEEAIAGTVMEKTAIKTKRKEVLGKLREHTDHLVRGTRVELDAKEDEPLDVALRRSWVAWTLSVKKKKLFGAQSFGIIALGSIFETIKEIEAAQSDEE